MWNATDHRYLNRSQHPSIPPVRWPARPGQDTERFQKRFDLHILRLCGRAHGASYCMYVVRTVMLLARNPWKEIAGLFAFTDGCIVE